MTPDIFGATDVGKVREANEDHFFVADLRTSLHPRQTNLQGAESLAAARDSTVRLLVVADGVGGMAGGALASDLAIRTVATFIDRVADCVVQHDLEQEDVFLQQLEASAHRAHDTLVSEFGANIGHGPATTLTMVGMVAERAYYLHIGDSRLYHWDQSRLRQVTRDQTMAEAMLDIGVMTEEEAARSSLSNMLASAIGHEVHPDVGLIDLSPGDALLLCSDGLTKHVTDEAIAEAFGMGMTAEPLCRRFIDQALEGGGTDNVSVIVARVPA